jgi:hypothetical protein
VTLAAHLLELPRPGFTNVSGSIAALRSSASRALMNRNLDHIVCLVYVPFSLPISGNRSCTPLDSFVVNLFLLAEMAGEQKRVPNQ